MANFVFNIAKGRVNELVERVNNNDPVNSALIVVPVDVGATTDAAIIDFDTLAAVLAGGVTERTAGGWARKTLTDVDLAAFTPDDTNDRGESDIPDQTWALVAAGNNSTDLLVCYDPDTTAGTDANIIPLTQHDFVVTTDGNDVVAQINAAGFFRAA